MRTLAIETAGEACSVALFGDGELLGHGHETIGRGHAERLIPMIAGLPDKGQAQEILVSLGPGSFTGVRVGTHDSKSLTTADRALAAPARALPAIEGWLEQARLPASGLTADDGFDKHLNLVYGQSIPSDLRAFQFEIEVITACNPLRIYRASARDHLQRRLEVLTDFLNLA